MHKSELPDFDLLKEMQSFDSAAFDFKDAEEKHTYTLILVFACLYNDLKDLLWALTNLLDSGERPKGLNNKYNGQYRGFYHHLIKLILSLLHEFLDLLVKQQETIKSKTFQDIVSTLTPNQQSKWNALVDCRGGSHTKRNSGVGRILGIVRNRIGYHYAYKPKDMEELIESFACVFRNKSSSDNQKPLLSYGKYYVENRFYFADAVIQHQLTKYPAVGKNNEFKELTDQVFELIGAIVVNFIVKVRGRQLKD